MINLICTAPNNEILYPSLMNIEEQNILANRNDVKAGLWKFHTYIGFITLYAIFEWTFQSSIGNDKIND